MKICVIIPTYNEAKTIGRLVRELAGRNLAVLAVDDGSSDNTSIIARVAGAEVLRNDLNEGKGASLVKGFNYAIEKGFDAVITMDGDGQHDVDDIKGFIEFADHNGSAVIVGNRMSAVENMPASRVLTNKFMSWFISRLIGQRVPDSQCGFRLIKKEALEKIKLASRRYEIESEILIRSARSGFKIGSVPVKTIYKGQRSQINPLLDTCRFVSFILKELLYGL